MAPATHIDIDHLRTWIGRTEELRDLIAAAPMAGLAATLDFADVDTPGEGDPVPPAGHWMYFLPKAPMRELGPDGHPHRGGFLPPVELPRRMWAGGRIEFVRPLLIGAPARRLSTIKDVTHKQGASGNLVFVVVEHQVLDADGLCIREEHDIVYRDSAAPGAPPPPEKRAPEGAVWSRKIEPDPVLLFRYSALTFNGHRIHYDLKYVTEEEGYPGLIVHGPLIATLLLDLCRRQRPDAALSHFDYRAMSPVFDTGPFTVNGRPSDDGATAALWATTNAGGLAMKAEARFVP
ncbi:MAG: MaoC family dehydratase N-terminal domain-containing protein [Rhodospirillaceae bacterium]